MEAQMNLGRIFGIKIGLHYSWLIIALLIAFSLAGHFGAAHPNWGRGVIWGMAISTAVLFFAAIVAHELSHALVARRRGLPVRGQRTRTNARTKRGARKTVAGRRKAAKK